MRLANRVVPILTWTLATLAVVCVLSFSLAFYLYSLSTNLPDLAVNPDALKTARTSIVYAANGSVIAEWHGEQDRTVVSFDDMPESLREAVVAIEDRRFYEHDGVDLMGIGRALGANAAAGDVEQGGSTITQQLVKILFTSRERSVTRKIREALLAYELETKNDKDKVLETYLNTIYFGRGAYGIESAARNYFGKPASALDLAESATLAGIIRSPSRYGAPSAVAETKKRRNVVLVKMREQGFITSQEARDASNVPLVFAASKEAGKVAPFFVEYVKQDLIDTLGTERVYAGGLRVYTSLEPDLQALAEKAATQLSAPGDPEIALVSVRPADGKVLAMVGGRDFKANQFNLATQGRRQPGSAFKPFVLVTALQEGIRPDQVFESTPYSVPVKDGVWTVQNYENRFTEGSMTLQAATDYSVNAVYARLIMLIGPEKVVKTAKRMGITAPLVADPAIALGGPEVRCFAAGDGVVLRHSRQRRRPGRAQRHRAGDRRQGACRAHTVCRDDSGDSARDSRAGLAHASRCHRARNRRSGEAAGVGRGQDRDHPVLSRRMVRGLGGRRRDRSVGWKPCSAGTHDERARHRRHRWQLPREHLA